MIFKMHKHVMCLQDNKGNSFGGISLIEEPVSITNGDGPNLQSQCN